MIVKLASAKLTGGDFANDLSGVRIILSGEANKQVEVSCDIFSFAAIVQRLNQIFGQIQAHSKQQGMGVPVISNVAEYAEAERETQSGNIIVGFRPKVGPVYAHSISPALARLLAQQLVEAAEQSDASGPSSTH